jgi:hypothetical protein
MTRIENLPRHTRKDLLAQGLEQLLKAGITAKRIPFGFNLERGAGQSLGAKCHRIGVGFVLHESMPSKSHLQPGWLESLTKD